MARSDTIRRVKSYSAATGYVYQYYFYEVEKMQRGDLRGTGYVYMVSVDRKNVFRLRIVVLQDATKQWAQAAGRPLSGTEEYAVAKMRLFQALDEIADLASHPPDLVIDSANLNGLLAQLDL